MAVTIPTKLKDVTNDWIKENFNLDEERRKIKREAFAQRTDYMPFNLEPGTNAQRFDSFVATINAWFDKTIKEEGIPENAQRMIRVREEDDYDFYECGGGSTTTVMHEVFLVYEVEETDGEVISRIKNRVKQQIRREQEKAKEARQAAKRETEEIKNLKRLVKKYKKEDVVRQLVEELK